MKFVLGGAVLCVKCGKALDKQGDWQLELRLGRVCDGRVISCEEQRVLRDPGFVRWHAGGLDLWRNRR